ncbi:sensor histidine kinase [Planomonospora alba]|uniref:sensor histidine kinase n=1 Tax=Planomonospora alba TaxID=161354 RepID=UPI0031E576EA
MGPVGDPAVDPGAGPTERYVLRDRFAVLLAPVVWLLLVAVGAAAWVWIGRLQRSAADQGLTQRTRVAAEFTEIYLDRTARRQREDAERLLAGADVGQREFELFGAAFGYRVTVLIDGRGRVMRVSPEVPGLAGRDLSAGLRYVRPAVQRHAAVVTNVYMSPIIEESLIAIAVPFRTPYGERIFSGGFVASESPLGVYLDRAVVPPHGNAYCVDRAGNIVAATAVLGPEVTPLSRLDPELAAALERHPEGDYRSGGAQRRYTSVPIGTTDWRLVTEAPHQEMYTGANEVQRRFGLVLLAGGAAGLAVAAAVSVTTHRRRRGERRLRRLTARYAGQAAELRAVNEELKLLAASVSHDLRTPLAAINGYAEVLAEEVPDGMPPEETARFLERIRRNTARMGDLIDALMAFSRLRRGGFHPRTVDLAALTREVWDDLAAHRDARDIRFELAELPPCRGDPDLLRQVMLTLLDNAIGSTRDRAAAHIEVGSRPGAGGRTAYYVRDDGAGFPPDQAEQLFRPFERLHTTGTYQGSGMGLNLARRIIARHRGDMWAESSPGRGSVFSFTLPFA